MKTIRYIVPYFGKLPSYFQMWLNTCSFNSTINWLVLTDDSATFDFPKNVERQIITFQGLRDRIQQLFDFQISLDRPYKLCDYKIAYGEIFKKELSGYDFWGYCDIDLLWGQIRHFYTDEVLSSYDKIGMKGHSTIYRNTPQINSIYRLDLKDGQSYREIYSDDKSYCADDDFINSRFIFANKKIFSKTNYAGLLIDRPGFSLQNIPESEKRFEKYHVFTWENGELWRHYLDGNVIKRREYLYIHFFKRPMKNKIKTMNERILIYPNCYKNIDTDITIRIVTKYGHKSKFSYACRMLWQYRKKITLKRISIFLKSLRC